MKSYWQAVDLDIVEVKRYILKVCNDIQKIHDLVNKSMDISILKKKIAKDKELELLVFTRIKRKIDRASSFDEMEKDLVMMNLLLDQHFYPLLVYKYKLVKHILDLGGFTVETYCLLRHLIKFSPKIIESFVLAICNRQHLSSERYYYLTCNILLLEKQYKKVYHYFKYISIDEKIERYLPALYNYNPRMYRKYARMMYIPLDLISE